MMVPPLRTGYGTSEVRNKMRMVGSGSVYAASISVTGDARAAADSASHGWPRSDLAPGVVTGLVGALVRSGIMPEQPDPPDAERSRVALERELYWAEETTSRATMDAQELRIVLQDLVSEMRADERSSIPRNEPQIGSPYRWRRKLKAGIFYFLRPMRRRYDRLLGDLSELVAMLAGRVAALEAEVERLRAEREARGPAPGDGRGSGRGTAR